MSLGIVMNALSLIYYWEVILFSMKFIIIKYKLVFPFKMLPKWAVYKPLLHNNSATFNYIYFSVDIYNTPKCSLLL